MISIENVGVQKGGRWLVRGVDWKLIPGRFHIILGPNCAGKSTLLRTLSGQFPPSEGAIYWDDLPLEKIPHPERHRAVLSQMHQLNFPLSVREVVELGAFPFRGQPGASERRRRMEEAMVKFELTELANRNVQTLSGGEQQLGVRPTHSQSTDQCRRGGQGTGPALQLWKTGGQATGPCHDDDDLARHAGRLRDQRAHAR